MFLTSYAATQMEYLQNHNLINLQRNKLGANMKIKEKWYTCPGVHIVYSVLNKEILNVSSRTAIQIDINWG